MDGDVDAVTAGGIAYVDDRIDEARGLWEDAFRDLRTAGHAAPAARVATLLAELHWGGLGNPSTGRGWLERARRLLEECGPCVEWGYWELARLACNRPDPAEIELSARRALAIATEFADVGLHTRALADLGYALVSQGRLHTGFNHLEEALACLTGGEVDDPFAVSTAWCALLSACDRAGDAERAVEWLEIVRELVLAPAGGRPRFLDAHCQVALGGVMCAVGEWSQAEEAVRTALQTSSGATASQRAEAASRLAELHLQHGRPELAAELLAPIEDELAAAGSLAQLHLARSEPDLAISVLRRAELSMGGDVLRRSDLLLLTVQSGLAADQLDIARHAATELVTLAEKTDALAIRGAAHLAEAMVMSTAAGRREAGLARLAAARDALIQAHRPLHTAQAWLFEAELTSSPADAVAAARAAHAIALRLDCPPLRDRAAAILRQQGATAPRPVGVSVLPELTARESEILDGLRRGDSNAEIAGQLFLSPKTVEHHVSRVLAKLGVRTRAEAAAVAAAAEARRSPVPAEEVDRRNEG